jgi:hypothetical protein
MARRGGEGGMSGGPMNTIIGGFIGLLVIVAIVILGPTLAGSIEEAQPAMGASSDWNSTHNTDLPNGVDLWTQNVTIGGVVILVFFIALAIYYIRVIA